MSPDRAIDLALWCLALPEVQPVLAIQPLAALGRATLTEFYEETAQQPVISRETFRLLIIVSRVVVWLRMLEAYLQEEDEG